MNANIRKVSLYKLQVNYHKRYKKKMSSDKSLHLQILFIRKRFFYINLYIILSYIYILFHSKKFHQLINTNYVKIFIHKICVRF